MNLASNALSSADCGALPAGRRANQTTMEIMPHQPSRSNHGGDFRVVVENAEIAEDGERNRARQIPGSPVVTRGSTCARASAM